MIWVGVLECWSVGALERWSVGGLERFWKSEKIFYLEHCLAVALEAFTD